jgi:hypothetical protein
MPYYLVYHPKRRVTIANGLKIYHDRFGGNEDPYIWNTHFLHTFCHITQFTNQIGQINFWVSSDHVGLFQELYCDCVFVVDQKIYWNQPNQIEPTDPIVDSPVAFRNHYQWVNAPYNQHHFSRRRRYTLKATAVTSFQPQKVDRTLVDILPFLNRHGLLQSRIKDGLTATRGSKPMILDESIGQDLYQYLWEVPIKLVGAQLSHLHPNQQPR